MLDAPEDFLGFVTFITGPEKHSGKTTFMNHAARLVRQAVHARGLRQPALMTVGYDGESRDYLTGLRKPAVFVQAGDAFVTAERFLRSGGASPEILDAAPGATALGRLCVARARRDGFVALVGPDGNSQVDWMLGRIVEGGIADTVFVDGAINRVTQVAGRAGARLVYALRIDRANLDRSVDRLARMAMLLDLPVESGDVDYTVTGALTSEAASRLPREARLVAVEDFTRIFLDRRELSVLLGERRVVVRHRPDFAGFSVATRAVDDCAVLEKCRDIPFMGASLADSLSFNPYEERAAFGGTL
ncbi:MAG: hypothetical protein E4H20_04170 [Spirochaetales bacterium]|nr:MAG: hypothetical protein E4H20_04170 [Spirochaetales bacterium]